MGEKQERLESAATTRQEARRKSQKQTNLGCKLWMGQPRKAKVAVAKTQQHCSQGRGRNTVDDGVECKLPCAADDPRETG